MRTAAPAVIADSGPHIVAATAEKYQEDDQDNDERLARKSSTPNDRNIASGIFGLSQNPSTVVLQSLPTSHDEDHNQDDHEKSQTARPNKPTSAAGVPRHQTAPHHRHSSVSAASLLNSQTTNFLIEHYSQTPKR
jgi:hypothetical protein